MKNTSARGHTILELLFVLALIAFFFGIVVSYSNNELKTSNRKQMKIAADLLLLDTENYFRTYCNAFMDQAVALADGNVRMAQYPFLNIVEDSSTNPSQFYNPIDVALIRSNIMDESLQPDLAKRNAAQLYNLQPDSTTGLNNWQAVIDFTNTIPAINTIAYNNPLTNTTTKKARSGLVQLGLHVQTPIPTDYASNNQTELLSMFQADVVAGGNLRWNKKLQPTNIGRSLQASRRIIGFDEHTHSACYF